MIYKHIFTGYRRALLLGLVAFFFSPLIYAQNDTEQTNGPDEIPKCTDLIEPETPEEVQALRECIRAKRNAKQQQNRKNRIQNSVRRDRELRESRRGSFCIPTQENPCDQVERPQPAN